VALAVAGALSVAVGVAVGEAFALEVGEAFAVDLAEALAECAALVAGVAFGLPVCVLVDPGEGV
jgi:hypothetical protein